MEFSFGQDRKQDFMREMNETRITNHFLTCFLSDVQLHHQVEKVQYNSYGSYSNSCFFLLFFFCYRATEETALYEPLDLWDIKNHYYNHELIQNARLQQQ